MKYILIILSGVILFSCRKYHLPPHEHGVTEIDTATIPILFIGQSNMVYRGFPCDVQVPRGYAKSLTGPTNNYSIVDWADLPDTSAWKTTLMMNNEGTIVPPFIIQFHDNIKRRLSVVRYGQSGTAYWSWRDTLDAQHTAYILMRRVADSFLVKQTMTNADLKYIVMYLGETDAINIGFDSTYAKQSLSNLYILVDQLHNDYPSAKVLIIETAYPKTIGTFKVRAEQDTVALHRNFVYVIDSTTRYFPNSWSSDGLHLKDSAYDNMAEETVKNMKRLFY